MAYRRKQGNARFPDIWPPPPPPSGDDPQPPPPPLPSIAAQAIRASSAHRDSSLSSVYGESAFSTARRNPNGQTRSASDGNAKGYEYTSIKNLSESKGFWNVLAQKAKNILELEKAAQRENPDRNHTPNFAMPADSQSPQSQLLSEGPAKVGSPKLQKGLDKITSSFNYIGEKVGSRLEEGISIVETRTANIIQETRKLNIRRKGSGSNAQAWVEDASDQHIAPQSRMNLEIQLKAARDVSNAMAAKAKLYVRELKTVKADLAFAKERCTQLEEENKLLRESNEKGGHPEDDDLIRLQLETLLAEKGRLAHENSVYARENRLLREIVEYHQLTMQDVVYLDEGIEQVTEVHPMQGSTLSYSPGASALLSSLTHTLSLDDPELYASMHPTSPGISSLGQANSLSNNLFGYGNSHAPTNPLPYNLFVHGDSPVFPVPRMQMLEERQTHKGGS